MAASALQLLLAHPFVCDVRLATLGTLMFDDQNRIRRYKIALVVAAPLDRVVPPVHLGVDVDDAATRALVSLNAQMSRLPDVGTAPAPDLHSFREMVAVPLCTRGEVRPSWADAYELLVLFRLNDVGLMKRVPDAEVREATRTPMAQVVDRVWWDYRPKPPLPDGNLPEGFDIVAGLRVAPAESWRSKREWLRQLLDDNHSAFRVRCPHEGLPIVPPAETPSPSQAE